MPLTICSLAIVGYCVGLQRWIANFARVLLCFGFKILAMEYRILLDRKVVGQKNGIGYINEEGARLIWEAYTKMNPYGTQTMERREERGGVCWLSEIRLFKEQGFLPESFNWTDYMVRLENFKT